MKHTILLACLLITGFSMAGCAMQPPAPDTAAVARVQTADTGNKPEPIPEMCRWENTPKPKNSAFTCRANFYAPFHEDVCGEWRKKCCRYEGVCS